MKTFMNTDVIVDKARIGARTILEQPDRYMNMDGDRLGAPFTNSYHRVEFKVAASAVAIVCAIAAGRYGMSVGEAFTAAASGVVGFYFTRLFEKDDALKKRVIDVEPDGSSDATSKKDLIFANERRGHAIEGLKKDAVTHVALTAAGTGLLILGAAWEDVETAGMMFGGASLSAGTTFFAGKFNTIMRMNRIMNKEYVVLSEPPQNNELKSWAKPAAKISADIP